MHRIHSRAFYLPPDEARIAYREERDRRRADIARFTAQLRAATALKMPLVYGALRKEVPVVKIGTSRAMPNQPTGSGRFGGKLSSIGLIALMHGSYAEERAIHHRLAASRVRMDDLPGSGVTEHFLITDEVVDWINETRSAIGLDLVTADELTAYSSRLQ